MAKKQSDLESGEASSQLSSLFSKPSRINNRDLLAKKVRTVVEVTPEPSSQDQEESEDDDEEEEEEEEEEAVEQPKKIRKLNNGKQSTPDENFDLEAKYMNKLLQEDESEASEEEEKDSSDDDASSDDDSVVEEEKPSANQKAKVVDLKDSELEKAERTIFVGNLPSSVMSSKKSTKALKNLFKENGPLESIRFRSFTTAGTTMRKVAYINKSFKEEDTTNCYIVFKNKADSLKAVALNGEVFMENHLRVDHVAHPLKQDNKLSVFVGNLDFEEKEESLWRFFSEKCVVNKDDTKIVSNVRIVRDSKTNFGKGFAIVQFTDTNYVEKALLLNKQKLTTSKKARELRISRCKNTENKNKQSQGGNSRVPLSDKQKTIIGRGKKLLNKSDRNSIGRLVMEGERAKKGQRVRGIKHGGSGSGSGKKKPRDPNSRAYKRSQEFKKKQTGSN